MKPVNLKMSAFIPFAKVVEVPFDKLGNNGIFLITGKTGAGKTTIFDGISFALFGETSGAYRDIKSVRSDFSKPEQKTFVELVFTHKNDTYLINRTPSYKRLKLKGEGFTKEIADAYVLKNEQLVVSGIDKCNDYIKDLIGINYEQFKQIAMIAQGEFLNLLFAKSSERIAIFRNIFNTNIFEVFQKDVKEIAHKNKRELEDININLQQYLKNLIVEDGEIEKNEIKNLIYKTDYILENTSEFIVQENEKLLKLNEKQKELLKDIENLTSKISVGEIENNLIENRIKNEEKLKQFLNVKDEKDKQKSFFENKKIAFNIILPLENDCIKSFENLEKKEVEIIKSSKSIEELSKEIEEKNKEKDNIELLKNEVENNKIELENLIKTLEIFTNKNNLEKENIEILKNIEKFTFDKNNVSKNIEKIENEKIENENKIQTLQSIENKIIITSQKCLEIEKILLKFNELNRDLEEFEIENNKLLNLRNRYKIKFGEWEKQTEICRNLEREFIKSQAGIFAQELENGKPCLVCGSITHPKKATKLESAPTEEELEILKKKIDDILKDVQNIKDDGTKCNEWITLNEAKNKETLKELNSDIKNWKINWENNKKNKSVLEKELQELKTEKSNIEKLKENIKLIIEKSENENKKMLELDNELIKMREQENILKGKLQNIYEQIKDFSSEESVCEKIETIKINIKENNNKIQKFEDYLKVKSEELNRIKGGFVELENQKNDYKIKLEKSKELFQNELENQKFKSELDYKNILPASFEDLENEDKEIKDYFLSIEKIENSLEESKNLIGKKIIDVSVLKEEKDIKNTENKNINEDIENKSIKLSILKKELEKAKELYVLQKAKEKEYLPILEIAQTANGDISGREKIAFETFVQGFYFQNVLILANERFKDMTNGRYILLKSRSAENKQSQSGLDIEILDQYTGEMRSVKSLSGGEAFKASLSLALGLSDMIQNFKGGIEIDVMLIDEGFGSLDDESRLQAVNVLQQLSTNNRLVGVISHIAEIKDNIDKKIIVEKKFDGSEIYMQI